MSYRETRCIICGRRIVKPVLVKEGKRYCNDCVMKTNTLLRTLSMMIP